MKFMHRIYITEGLVLKKRGVGEANALVWILTPDLGLVRASARSARVAPSKLRYGIEVLTVGRYALVKGRYEWRLTGAEAMARLPAVPAIGRIAQLLLRLVNGEEPHPGLYKTVAHGFALLAEATHPDSVETVVVLRILSHLGYLPETPALSQFVQGDLSVELSAKALESRSLLIKTINESLQATGL